MAKLDENEKKNVIEDLNNYLKEKEAELKLLYAKTRIDLKNSQKIMKPEDSTSIQNVDLPRIDPLEETVKELKKTILRVEKTGEYGACQDKECGEEIPEERLKINPIAKFCLGCQEKRDKKDKEKRKIAGMSGTRTGSSGPIY